MDADADRANVLARLEDGRRLLALREAIHRGAGEPGPFAELVTDTDLTAVRDLGLLPGSFNPPTRAHLALAQAALDTGAVGAVLLTLSTHTVDKEQVTGAALEDRLLLLELLCAGDPRLGVLLLNRGLYVEQAELARAAIPGLDRVVFLLGFDKIVQIFDARYYDDRDAALQRLFSLAEIRVAPRADVGPDALEALLDRPQNRRFRHAVRPLEIPPSVRYVSSSAVRAKVVQGGNLEELPYVVRVFVEETGAYDAAGAGSGRYDRRLAALERAEQGDGPPARLGREGAR